MNNPLTFGQFLNWYAWYHCCDIQGVWIILPGMIDAYNQEIGSVALDPKIWAIGVLDENSEPFMRWLHEKITKLAVDKIGIRRLDKESMKDLYATCLFEAFPDGMTSHVAQSIREIASLLKLDDAKQVAEFMGFGSQYIPQIEQMMQGGPSDD